MAEITISFFVENALFTTNTVAKQQRIPIDKNSFFFILYLPSYIPFGASVSIIVFIRLSKLYLCLYNWGIVFLQHLNQNS